MVPTLVRRDPRRSIGDLAVTLLDVDALAQPVEAAVQVGTLARGEPVRAIAVLQPGEVAEVGAEPGGLGPGQRAGPYALVDAGELVRLALVDRKRGLRAALPVWP